MAINPLPVLDRTSVGFKNDVDLFFGTQLPAFSAQANALQADVNAKQSSAATSETNALASKNAAATSATNAATSETNALASKNAAATSATNASTSATNAAASETNALSSKNAAASSATNAATSATNASNSAAAAAAAVASIAGGPVASINGKTGVVTLVKADLALGSVDNTSDANKPVSTAQALAIAAVLPALAGNAGKILSVNQTATGVEWITSAAALALVPTVPGTPYGGGFYVGRLKIGADSYALIVAPKASGESSSLALKTTSDTTAGTTSTWDGAANTAAMIAAGAAAHPAANFCKNLSVGGYTDWVLPAKDQLELCYRNLKPTTTTNDTTSGANPNSDPVGAIYTAGNPVQTAIAAYQTGGAEAFASSSQYWSSTESSSANNYRQSFNSGIQGNFSKNTAYYVRAVRMIKI